jgi:DDE superfamily endonuclease
MNYEWESPGGSNDQRENRCWQAFCFQCYKWTLLVFTLTFRQLLKRCSTLPGLLLKKGRYGTMTQDCKHNGTTTLFAALETVQGRVIGPCYQRNRHQEFLNFLRKLDKEFPGKIPLHLIMDNCGTHKHDKVRGWLKRHPRFLLHFVPTRFSWLNLVERCFGELSAKAIRRGVFHGVNDLKSAIDGYKTAWNNDPKLFVWNATVESITRKLFRCQQTLGDIQPGYTIPETRKRKK